MGTLTARLPSRASMLLATAGVNGLAKVLSEGWVRGERPIGPR